MHHKISQKRIFLRIEFCNFTILALIVENFFPKKKMFILNLMLIRIYFKINHPVGKIADKKQSARSVFYRINKNALLQTVFWRFSLLPSLVLFNDHLPSKSKTHVVSS